MLICAGELTNDVISIEKWSEDSNLIFNAGKTKSVLFSTQEMSIYHNLHEKIAFTIYRSGKALERAHSTKLLGFIIHEHLKWNDHVNELLNPKTAGEGRGVGGGQFDLLPVAFRKMYLLKRR